MAHKITIQCSINLLDSSKNYEVTVAGIMLVSTFASDRTYCNHPGEEYILESQHIRFKAVILLSQDLISKA